MPACRADLTGGLRRGLCLASLAGVSLAYLRWRWGLKRRWSAPLHGDGPPARPAPLLERDALAVRRDLLEGHDPAAREAVLAAAEEALAGRVPILGLGSMPVGRPPDWHRDWAGGGRWPLKPSQAIDYLDFGSGTDVRLTWELNRCHHLVWLAQAHLFSGRPEYAREVRRQMADWAGANPPGLGVNWAVAMESAIRLVNWVWAWSLIQGDEGGDEGEAWFVGQVRTHARHILANLEFGRRPGNHFLANGAGLLLAGLTLPGDPEAGRWLRRGLDILVSQVPRQFHSDGGNFEASIGYHRLSLELCLVPLLLAQARGCPIPARVWRRLRAAGRFMASYVDDDGGGPNFGDNDDGRLLRLIPRPPQDHAALLGLAAEFFADRELSPPRPAGAAETIWLLGRPPAPPPRGRASRPGWAHARSGLYVMQSPGLRVWVDAGGVGSAGQGSHAHNDTLSFELAAWGQRVIVDAGTWLYTADRRERAYFRGSAAHNVTVVDGREMAEERLPGLPWGLKDQARPRVLGWRDEPGRALLIARQHGYQRLDQGVVTQRTLSLDKARDILGLEERLFTSGRHAYCLALHLAPGMRAQGDYPFLEVGAENALGPCLRIEAEGPEKAGFHLTTGWVSPIYGAKERGQVVEIAWQAQGNSRLGLTIAALPPPAKPFSDPQPGRSTR